MTDNRQYATLGNLPLESGGELPSVVLAYETWGTFTGDNAILVEHALTGDSTIAGGEGWWSKVVGPGLGIDTNTHFVVAANILGGCAGSTGPEDLEPFPALTVRDQVAAEARLADHLGVDIWKAVIGGSAGGMRALEWAVSYPERVERLLSIAVGPYATAEQIAWTTIQNDMVRVGGPVDGLDLARRVAHVTYRSEPELAARFGRTVQDDGRWAIESYLQHHGTKLVNRFSAKSYIVLNNAMNSHDLGRDRGGLETALQRISARTIIAAIDSDRLYRPGDQQIMADEIPGCEQLDMITSMYGHDGFLIEFDQVNALARRLLAD